MVYVVLLAVTVNVSTVPSFFRNSDSRDVSRITTVSTLPLTTKYPKLPDPPNPPSVLIGEIHSKETPQNEL